MADYQPFVQPVLIISVLFTMLKFMVVDKLKTITDGLNSHEIRLRRQENMSAYLKGKGCMNASCPLSESDEEDS